MTIIESTPLTESMIPQTWLNYYNGPTAGFVDLGVARREMPWLFGQPCSVSQTDNACQPPL